MDPATLMTCVQVASSVAGMLSPKGPGIGELISIQVQMLKNISSQISKLQDGINVIINDIDQLKKYVRYELPSEIYKTFITQDMLAAFTGFDAAIYAYIYDRQDKGILKGYHMNKDSLLMVLDRIQIIRSKLFLYNDYFLAPVVARCFKIEMDLMIILYEKDRSTGQFLSFLLDYESWLEKMQNENFSYSVDYHIKLHKEKFDQLIQSSAGFNICTPDTLIERKERREMSYNFGYVIHEYIKGTATYYSFKRIYSQDFEEQMKAYNSDYSELEAIYDDLKIDRKYMPSQVSQTVDKFLRKEEVELHFVNEYYNAIPGDQKAYQMLAYQSSDAFNISKDYFLSNKCTGISDKIFTKTDFYSVESNITAITKQMIVPVTHKKIMTDIQNKIYIIKTKISNHA